MHINAIKAEAKFLRAKGFSLEEIANQFGISRSTASLWLSGVTLSASAKERLTKKTIEGQQKGLLTLKTNREKAMTIRIQEAYLSLQSLTLSKELAKLLCALLWWCEGNKTTSWVRFTNSDITMVRVFLMLLRKGFSIDESKLRALVQIHAYHTDKVQKLFWSTITGIPLSQFHRSTQKTNTTKHSKENYPGCVMISYYDHKIAKELLALYTVFCKAGGIVQR